MDAWFEKQRKELLRIIEKFTLADGTHDTKVPGLRLIRISRSSEPVYSVYEPSLCVVAQGSKVVMLGQEMYQYDSNSFLTSSVHLAITGQVMEASSETRYLSAQIIFDMNQILDVIQAAGDSLGAGNKTGRGLKLNKLTMCSWMQCCDL